MNQTSEVKKMAQEKNKKLVVMLSNQGIPYNRAVNGIHRLMAQKNIMLNNSEHFETQSAELKVIQAMVDVFCATQLNLNDESYIEMLVSSFGRAVKEFKDVENKRLIELFGKNEYEALFTNKLKEKKVV
jgi:hypothetical protein